MSKDTFVKASFMFLTIFLDICENPRRNTVINPCYPKHPKIKIEKKKRHKFLFSIFFAVHQEGFMKAGRPF